MKRFWIILLAAAMALVIAMPAGAGKPPINCDKKPDHPACATFECLFVEGVLQGWDGSERYQCQWNVTELERAEPFYFKLEPVSADGKTVNLPHLIVMDVYPFGGNTCINEYEVGWSDLPYSWTELQIPTDGTCLGSGGTADPDSPDVFAITIDVIKVKKGPVSLTYTHTPPEVSSS